MSAVRIATGMVLVAAACVLGTMWLGWVSLPLVGLVYGFSVRRARARGTIAAAGAVIAWIAILGAAAARGADVRTVAEQVGSVLQIPGSAFMLITLLFAALLCGTAAVLGAVLGAVIGRSGARRRPQVSS
jgi:hypothetical protein